MTSQQELDIAEATILVLREAEAAVRNRKSKEAGWLLSGKDRNETAL